MLNHIPSQTNLELNVLCYLLWEQLTCFNKTFVKVAISGWWLIAHFSNKIHLQERNKECYVITVRIAGGLGVEEVSLSTLEIFYADTGTICKLHADPNWSSDCEKPALPAASL